MAKRNTHSTLTKPLRSDAYQVRRYHRYWEVVDATGELVCLTVYKRGAKEVIRRLQSAECDLNQSSSAS